MAPLAPPLSTPLLIITLYKFSRVSTYLACQYYKNGLDYLGSDCVSMGSMGSVEPMDFESLVPEPMDFEGGFHKI